MAESPLTVAFVSDDHAPYTDHATLACRIDIIKHIKPDVVFLGGDLLDFYQVSKFDKDPVRLTELQADIDYAHDLVKKYRRSAPQAKMYYLSGNHEERLQSYVWRNAAALASLQSMKVYRLLNLDVYGVQWVEEGWYDLHGFIFKHGNTVRNRSGYSAAGEMDRFWCSGMSGHTHRLGMTTKTAYRTTATWCEAGCGCKPLDYVKGGPADWQQGMGLAYYYRSTKTWVPMVIPIVGGHAVVDGQLRP